MEADVVLDRRLNKQRLAPFLQRSDARGLAQALLHLAAIGASGLAVWLARPYWWLLLPAMALHGLLLTFLFAAAHETIHRSAFRSRWLNQAMGWLAGAVLVLPPDYFRAFHFAHHAHTSDPASDPELAYPKPATRRAYLWHVSGLPYWIGQLKVTLTHALGRVPESFISPRMTPKIVREARLLLALYAALLAVSIALQSTALVWLWIVPALLGQPFLRLFLLAEHWGCPEGRDMLRNTRTTKTNALVCRLTWNMPYHVEHHAYPAVPFFALPDLHPLIRADIAELTPGYLALHRRVWRSFGETRS
jgi:fatty acid desaturase